MNAHDRRLEAPAVLRYETPDFEVLQPGDYVLCAVSGRRIPLGGLRYWSAELQEAYAGPDQVLARLRELGRAG